MDRSLIKVRVLNCIAYAFFFSLQLAGVLLRVWVHIGCMCIVCLCTYLADSWPALVKRRQKVKMKITK